MFYIIIIIIIIIYFYTNREYIVKEEDVGCEFKVKCIPVRSDGYKGEVFSYFCLLFFVSIYKYEFYKMKEPKKKLIIKPNNI